MSLDDLHAGSDEWPAQSALKGRRRSLFPALVASIALHALLLVWLIDSMIEPMPAPAPATMGLAVSLVQGSPQQRAAVVPEVPATQTGTQSTALTAVTAPAPSMSAAPIAATAEVAAPATVAPATTPSATAATATRLPLAVHSGAANLQPDGLDAAIQTFVQGLQTGQTAAWTSDCMRRQREQLQRDCPERPGLLNDLRDDERRAASQAFAAVTREDRHARLRKDLTLQYQRMEVLQEQGGAVAQLAAEREGLSREYLAYLSGNFNSSAMAFVQASQRDNPNLPMMLGNMLQFICSPQPCVYEHTDFVTGRRPVEQPPLPAPLDAQARQPWLPRQRLWPAAAP